MIIKDNIIYAGITTEKGIELFNSIPNIKTGYVFKKINDGRTVGNKVILNNEKEINMYIEVMDELQTMENKECFHDCNTNIIYAGITTEEGLELYKKMDNPYTGKVFVRIHDNFVFGTEIQLGNDFSYKGTLEGVRIDSPNFYLVKDEGECENDK